MGSTNATFVNGRMVKKPVQLNYGDKILLGETVLRFFIEENTIRK
jgi:pSer/pThr/pTyr-binding forkhead associated (FHA) protein